MVEAMTQLVRRFAATSVLSEQLEARLVEGAPIDIDEHTKLSASLVKIGTRIGLGRRAKQIPSLDEYLRTKAQRADDGDDSNVIEHDHVVEVAQ